MCIYNTLIENKKYIPNIKNKGKPPKAKDNRVKAVPIGCGFCIECKKRKKRDWQVRLHEEMKRESNEKAYMVNLTFDNKSLTELELLFPNLSGYELDKAAATKGVRRWLERVRTASDDGKSIRHWLITELGQTNTERIHLHGIIWYNDIEFAMSKWNYGMYYIGEWVNEKTVNYIVKYVSKTDKLHRNFTPKVLASTRPAIGSNYFGTSKAKLNEFRGEETREYYKTYSGIKLPLPIYYRNKIYSDEERESLWIYRLDKNERYVDGKKIKLNVETGEGLDKYRNAVKAARAKNKRLGYGTNQNWKWKEYEEDMRNLLRKERHEKVWMEQSWISDI